METKQAILPLSAPVSISMLLCFGNRHNHITVCDETILISPIGLYQQTCQYVSSPLFPKIWLSFRFYSSIDLEGNTIRPAPVGSQHSLVPSSPFASLDRRSAARLCSSSDGTQKYSFTCSGRRTPSIPRRQPAIKAKSLGSDGYAPRNPLADKSSGILKYSSQQLAKPGVSTVFS